MYQDHKKKNQILIVTGRKVMPQRIISLPDDIPAIEIRKYLMQFIDEKESKPTIIDILAESFGL